MKQPQPLPNVALFALGLVSILFGMMLFEVLCVAEPLPIWTLLPALFAAGIVGKVIEIMRQHQAQLQLLPRVVTVEFDWSVTT